MDLRDRTTPAPAIDAIPVRVTTSLTAGRLGTVAYRTTAVSLHQSGTFSQTRSGWRLTREAALHAGHRAALELTGA